MPPARKRRAADPEDSDASQPQHARRRQRSRSASEDEDMSDASHNSARAPTSLDALVKKMVRFALASEYARIPIRRADISAKVLGEQGKGMFKKVFEQAQRHLREKFGMEMTELPPRDNQTTQQRRAALRTEKPSTSNKSWNLSTTLPLKYRNSSILVPTKAPSISTESTYTALYTFIIAVIKLNGNRLPEQKLERYLARTNLDQYTPIDKTERLLQRLCKEGYIVRNREVEGGEETIEYIVGPRGKVEVGSSGVAGLVREVYGYGPEASGTNGNTNGNGNGSDDEGPTQAEREVKRDFEVRLRRTLEMPALTEQAEQTEEPPSRSQANGHREEEEQGPRRTSRRAAPVEEESEEEEEEEDEESD
ncbi:MAGE protein [Penicillium pulvis]|uniref:MAGE protein n=1 Tax=Penicillium pulvis TaxID=1562058 RepID=UPI002549AD58|nr:MAGE protein [Penicillium pulvis]KAJ5785619.1 MAGE protein [Penicillium pulvis]